MTFFRHPDTVGCYPRLHHAAALAEIDLPEIDLAEIGIGAAAGVAVLD